MIVYILRKYIILFCYLQYFINQILFLLIMFLYYCFTNFQLLIIATRYNSLYIFFLILIIFKTIKICFIFIFLSLDFSYLKFNSTHFNCFAPRQFVFICSSINSHISNNKPQFVWILIFKFLILALLLFSMISCFCLVKIIFRYKRCY